MSKLLGLPDRPMLARVMSRDGKRLRDDVIDFVLTHAVQGLAPNMSAQFREQIADAYSPLQFECAVLYAHPSDIFEAIQRCTSGAYQQRKDAKPDTRGVVRGVRAKNVDWHAVARCDPSTWIPCCDTPRATGLRIHPNDFSKCAPTFAPMYLLFTSWFVTDFSFTTLAKIWDAARKYDINTVKECMDRVESVEHRRIDYLLAIIDEQTDRDEYVAAEAREYEAQSKQLLDTLTGIAHSPQEKIDWGKLEEQAQLKQDNQDAFDKVKLS